MNALSKFSLMMAFTTALFCLLMLSKGFAASPQRHEQYYFMGQDRAGKVILCMEMQQRLGCKPTSVIRMYSERDGWIKFGQAAPCKAQAQIGENHPSVRQGGFPGSIQYKDDANQLEINLNANKVGLDEKNFMLASGFGELKWKDRDLRGFVLLRKHKSNSSQTSMPLPSKPGEWREQITLNLAGEGTLHLFRQSQQDPSENFMEIGGYLEHDSLSGRAQNLEISTVSWKKLGLYSLPYAWQGRFEVAGKPVVFRISSERPSASNLLFKGKRQSLARGFVKVGNTNYSVFGLAEMDHVMKSEKQILAFEASHKVAPTDKGMNWETARKR